MRVGDTPGGQAPMSPCGTAILHYMYRCVSHVGTGVVVYRYRRSSSGCTNNRGGAVQRLSRYPYHIIPSLNFMGTGAYSGDMADPDERKRPQIPTYLYDDVRELAGDRMVADAESLTWYECLEVLLKTEIDGYQPERSAGIKRAAAEMEDNNV